MKRLFALVIALAAASCAPTEGPSRPLSPQLLPDTDHADTRVNGPIDGPMPLARPSVSYGTPGTVSLPAQQDAGAGDVSLDFADTDIREVVAQILGQILRVNYTIDPAVHGTATLHTVTPLARSQLLPTLQALLSETGATLVDTDGLYRVLPAGAAGAAGPQGPAAGGGVAGLAAGGATAGGQLLPLRYASAVDLAKVLQPYAGQNARVAVDPGSNSLIISGQPEARDALAALAQAFDINLLAGQSYALLPAPQGAAADFASALETAFRAQGGGLTNVVRVVPMERVGSVLLVASEPQYIDEARRVYDLVQARQRQTVRNWHVYYLQDSKAEDAAYVLQEAFTPDNITATPSGSGTSNQASAGATTGTAGGTAAGGMSGDTGINATSAATGGGIGSSGVGAGSGLAGGADAQSGGATGSGSPSGTPTQTAANPLLGGLDSGAGGSASGADALRIIPDVQNNSVLIFATQDEEDRINAMLRKIDIVPLQVRIDATIAEVTLNSELQYGTQFFFRSGGINGILNNTAQTTTLVTPAATALSPTFPGFILSGSAAGGAPIALQALQAVTTVKVLSSPELMVLDGQTAHLQVGDLVPYLTSSAQSSVANSAVINNINYQPTGVIMNVTPRVSENGLVTLDISQQVSAINTSVTTTTTGISSPTFSEQDVSSRVIVQDGQTVGLAGLITDNLSKTNSGIPFLKDIPLIGLLAGTQKNTRVRSELLVLITPHVQYDQRDARALTADLQDQLQDAAAVPGELNSLQSPGSDDPNAVVRSKLRLDQ
jgi:general secretion pathway protein D